MHPPASAVEQIGDHHAVIGPGDAGAEHGAHDLTDGGIVCRLGEQGGAGDDLAAGVALAVAESLPGLVELTAGGELGR